MKILKEVKLSDLQGIWFQLINYWESDTTPCVTATFTVKDTTFELKFSDNEIYTGNTMNPYEENIHMLKLNFDNIEDIYIVYASLPNYIGLKIKNITYLFSKAD